MTDLPQVAAHSNTASETTSRIARQGIFTAEGTLAGYELFFRGYGVDAAQLPAATLRLPGVSEHDRATSQVIVSTFADFGFRELSGGVPLFINMTRPFFTGELPLPFPPDNVVLEILESVRPEPDVLRGLRSLAEQGYTLAIDSFELLSDQLHFLPYASYVKMQLHMTPAWLAEVMKQCREVTPSVQFVAEKVENWQTFESAKQLGFSLFQGYLFERPAVLQRQQLSTSELVCLKLMRLLSQDAPDPVEAERLVAADPTLSMRIFKTVNSAAGTAGKQVTSLRQALVLLGPRQLNTWVLLTLVGGMTQVRPDHVSTLLAQALTAEALADRVGVPPDEAFTVALMAALAESFGFSMSDMLVSMNFPQQRLDELQSGNCTLCVLVDDIRHHAANRYSDLRTAALTGDELARTYLHAWTEANQMVMRS